jgi:flavin-binding protein dodecin
MADGVYRVTEIIGVSSESWDAAARSAVETAAKTVRDLRIAEVLRQDVIAEGGSCAPRRARGASDDLRPVADLDGLGPTADPLERAAQLVQARRLRYVGAGAGLYGGPDRFLAEIRREDDHRRTREADSQLATQVRAAHVWQPKVDQHDVGEGLPRAAQCVARVGDGAHDAVSRIGGERVDESGPHDLVVIDDQDSNRRDLCSVMTEPSGRSAEPFLRGRPPLLPPLTTGLSNRSAEAQRGAVIEVVMRGRPSEALVACEFKLVDRTRRGKHAFPTVSTAGVVDDLRVSASRWTRAPT